MHVRMVRTGSKHMEVCSGTSVPHHPVGSSASHVSVSLLATRLPLLGGVMNKHMVVNGKLVVLRVPVPRKVRIKKQVK